MFLYLSYSDWPYNIVAWYAGFERLWFSLCFWLLEGKVLSAAKAESTLQASTVTGGIGNVAVGWNWQLWAHRPIQDGWETGSFKDEACSWSLSFFAYKKPGVATCGPDKFIVIRAFSSVNRRLSDRHWRIVYRMKLVGSVPLKKAVGLWLMHTREEFWWSWSTFSHLQSWVDS